MSVRGLLLCGCLCLLGCASAHQQPPPRTLWLPSYALGAIGGGDLDLRDVCPHGARELAIGSTWATLGIAVATLGVYTPREVSVRCAP